MSPNPRAPPCRSLCTDRASLHPHGQDRVKLPQECKTVAALSLDLRILLSFPKQGSVYTYISWSSHCKWSSSFSFQTASNGIMLPRHLNGVPVCQDSSLMRGSEVSASKHQKRWRRTGHWSWRSKIIREPCMFSISAYSEMSCWTSGKFATLATHSSRTERALRSHAPRKMCFKVEPRTSLSPCKSPCRENGWHGKPAVICNIPEGRRQCAWWITPGSWMSPWITGWSKLAANALHAKWFFSMNTAVFIPKGRDPKEKPPIPAQNSIREIHENTWMWREHAVSLLSIWQFDQVIEGVCASAERPGAKESELLRWWETLALCHLTLLSSIHHCHQWELCARFDVTDIWIHVVRMGSQPLAVTALLAGKCWAESYKLQYTNNVLHQARPTLQEDWLILGHNSRCLGVWAWIRMRLDRETKFANRLIWQIISLSSSTSLPYCVNNEMDVVFKKGKWPLRSLKTSESDRMDVPTTSCWEPAQLIGGGDANRQKPLKPLKWLD